LLLTAVNYSASTLLETKTGANEYRNVSSISSRLRIAESTGIRAGSADQRPTLKPADEAAADVWELATGNATQFKA
jgi:hypothetical protein